jgi:hypothetical protein
MQPTAASLFIAGREIHCGDRPSQIASLPSANTFAKLAGIDYLC